MNEHEKRKQRAEIIVRELKKLFPHKKTVLHYSTPWELLFAVMLSAQTTDKLVNSITEKLFIKYPSVESYAHATQAELEQDIHSVNFYRNKAKNIIATATILLDQYQGRVPDTMEALTSLPGVARKTANVILSTIYNKAEGVVVDTHVKRLSKLYGLTDEEDPVKIERDLMSLLPLSEWKEFSFRMIDYGRAYCPARPHDHEKCPLVIALQVV